MHRCCLCCWASPFWLSVGQRGSARGERPWLCSSSSSVLHAPAYLPHRSSGSLTYQDAGTSSSDSPAVSNRLLPNKPLQQPNAPRSARGGLVPRRRRLRPRLLAAVVRSKATLAFAGERQVVIPTARMRFLLAMTVVLSGCASAGRVMATGDARVVRFEFARGDRPVRVGGISVYKVEQGRRGTTLYDSRRAATGGAADLRSWVYGRDVGPQYSVTGCPPLGPGRVYGVNVDQWPCMSFTNFRLADDGGVVDLGPNDVTCTM